MFPSDYDGSGEQIWFVIDGTAITADDWSDRFSDFQDENDMVEAG